MKFQIIELILNTRVEISILGPRWVMKRRARLGSDGKSGRANWSGPDRAVCFIPDLGLCGLNVARNIAKFMLGQ